MIINKNTLTSNGWAVTTSGCSKESVVKDVRRGGCWNGRGSVRLGRSSRSRGDRSESRQGRAARRVVGVAAGAREKARWLRQGRAVQARQGNGRGVVRLRRCRVRGRGRGHGRGVVRLRRGRVRGRGVARSRLRRGAVVGAVRNPNRGSRWWQGREGCGIWSVRKKVRECEKEWEKNWESVRKNLRGTFNDGSG